MNQGLMRHCDDLETYLKLPVQNPTEGIAFDFGFVLQFPATRRIFISYFKEFPVLTFIVDIFIDIFLFY